MIFNLGMLGFFKYYNFYSENFIVAFEQLVIQMDVFNLQIILPGGISFYTFQTLSYAIDVYQKKIAPSNNFVSFASFVSFYHS